MASLNDMAAYENAYFEEISNAITCDDTLCFFTNQTIYSTEIENQVVDKIMDNIIDIYRCCYEDALKKGQPYPLWDDIYAICEESSVEALYNLSHAYYEFHPDYAKIREEAASILDDEKRTEFIDENIQSIEQWIFESQYGYFHYGFHCHPLLITLAEYNLPFILTQDSNFVECEYTIPNGMVVLVNSPQNNLFDNMTFDVSDIFDTDSFDGIFPDIRAQLIYDKSNILRLGGKTA